MSDTARRYRPRLEDLEDRLVLTRTVLLVDFGQDPGLRPLAPDLGFDGHTFAQTFNLTDASGHGPAFLDFNGDGQVNAADVPAAAGAVVQDVANYFAPFQGQHVTVSWADVTQETGVGRGLLRQGIRSKRLQGFVVYVGGAEVISTVFGRAVEAAKGFNYEGYGRVYPEAVVPFLEATDPTAAPATFAADLASSVAHEFGHLLGLGHPFDATAQQDNVMEPLRVRGQDGFVSRSYPAFLVRRAAGRRFLFIGRQDPFAELRRSFRGQPDENAGRPRQVLGQAVQLGLRTGAHPDDAEDGLTPQLVDSVFVGVDE